MAEKAIRLGGESTADAIVSAVDAMYTEHTFAEKDFALKHNEDEISVDTNFAAQNFWKEALIRFFNKKSADRKSTRLNSSHYARSRMPSSA